MPTLRQMALRALMLAGLLSTGAAAGATARMTVGATVVSSARVSVAASPASLRISLGARQHAAVTVGTDKAAPVRVDGAADLALPRTGDVVVTILVDG